MTDKALTPYLVRALAARAQGMFEGAMPPAPQQGPAPRFLESAVPGAPEQGPPPVFPRAGSWATPEGMANNANPVPPPSPMAPRPARPAAMSPQGMPAPQSALPDLSPPQQVGPMAQQQPGMLPASFIPNMTAAQAYEREYAANPGAFDGSALRRWLGWG